MFRIWIRFLVGVTGVVLTPGVYRALAIEVSTPKELTVVNGTDAKLKCTFTSTHPVSEKSVSVSWSFKAFGQSMEERFFYYLETPFPPDKGLFKGRTVWSGNVLKYDASITLNNVQSNFNGTYTCQVLNPPDVHGFTSEIRLEVVQSVKLSEIGILAAAVGGAIALVLLILTVIFAVRYIRGRHGGTDIELRDTKQGSGVCAQGLQPMNRPENELEKDELRDDLEKAKLHEEEAEVQVKDSDA